MPEYSDKGMSLFWGAPDSPVNGLSRLVLGVRPADPANVVEVFLTDPSGVERCIRAAPGAVEDGAQMFTAHLPVAPGQALTFSPRLSRAGRVLDPAVRDRPGDVTVDLSQTPLTPRPIEFDFLGRLTARLAPPQAVGDTPEGLQLIFAIETGGACVGPMLDAKITHVGGDWMVVRPDGVGESNVRLLMETTDGALISGEYGGLAQFGAAAVPGLRAGVMPPIVPFQCAPFFLTSHPKYAWINRLQCIASGHADTVKSVVTYDIWSVRSDPTRGEP